MEERTRHFRSQIAAFFMPGHNPKKMVRRIFRSKCSTMLLISVLHDQSFLQYCTKDVWIQATRNTIRYGMGNIHDLLFEVVNLAMCTLLDQIRLWRYNYGGKN